MENETIKLVNVLRRIARAAGYTAWNQPGPEAASFCVNQYNKVLARLSELEPNVKTLFTPLPDNASPEVTRMAARELVAYFEDEAPNTRSFEFAFGCRPRGTQGRVRTRCFTIPICCD